jgi:hypothetical protein
MVLFLQTVAQPVLFVNGWSKDSFTCCISSLTFAFDRDGSFLASVCNSLTEVVVGQVLDGEFEQVFIVQLALFIHLTKKFSRFPNC